MFNAKLLGGGGGFGGGGGGGGGVGAEHLGWVLCKEGSIIHVHTHRVCTAQQTHSISVTQTSQLMLYREIIAVCSQIHTNVLV